METFAPNDKADYYSGITSITVNWKNAYKLKGKFLDDLHNNAFSGTNGKDAVEHIEYYLKIIDPIKLPNVNHDKLRIVVFPISLAGGARRWFDGINESITYWVHLTAKYFRKYYPPSRIKGNNTPDYWKMGGDEIEVSDDESSDVEEYWRYYGVKTYEDYNDDWIYEWNKNVPWVYDKPWLDNGIWKELKPVKHTCKPFNYKTGCSEWPTCSWREDGYCNGGNFLGAYVIGNSLHYQDLEWYEALKDCELKEEALRNKAIMDGLIEEVDDDESRYEQRRRWNVYTNYDDAYEINHNVAESEKLCEIHELPVCNIKRFETIKYSFGQDKEYVAIKEDEYNHLERTSEDACRAYQEIFRMMDEGWMVTRAE
ncbi:hypothetical protein Tco_0884443 [Tanacetum coccineum]